MKQNLGSRLLRMSEDIPSVEWEFHILRESEREACLRYEIFRERAFCRGEVLHEQIALLKDDVAETGGEFCSELLELVRELDDLSSELRPWLSLTAKDKIPFLRRRFECDLERQINEPVWATADLTPFQKWRVKFGGKRMSIEVNVDWSRNNGAIVKSFAKLVKSLRQQRFLAGKQIPPCAETKGDKATVEERLFYLAIWRLSKAGIRPIRVIKIVEPLRGSFFMADKETLKKRFASYVTKAERLF
jgi:hypothetical protein